MQKDNEARANLSALGHKTDYNFGYTPEVLETFENKHPDNDYSRYDFNLFSEENKRRYRDEHFPVDLQNAYALGQRLVEKALKAAGA